jgi:hypothetical protein
MQRNYILKAFDADMRRAIRQPPNILELWQLAQDYYITEESIKSSTSSKPKPKTSSSSSSTSSTSSTTSAPQKRDKKDITCYSCKEKGHYSTECPNRDATKPERKDVDTSAEEDVCFKCGGKGHRSPACPSLKTTKEGDAAKAKRQRTFPTATAASDKRPSPTPAPKLHFDTRELNDDYSKLGAEWRSPSYHHFDAIPISTPQYHPSDFSNCLASYYYYESKDNKQREEVTGGFQKPAFPAHQNLMKNNEGGKTIEGRRSNGLLPSRGSGTSFRPEGIRNGPNFIDAITDESINDRSQEEMVEPSQLIQTLLSSPASSRAPANNCMQTITHAANGKDLLTILDTGTAVNVVTEGVLKDGGFPLIPRSDIVLESADDMNTTPMGMCKEYKFSISDVEFTVQVYVVKKASFQLLLGNEFLWKVGAALFPRWGAFAITLPTFKIINATCHRINAKDAPPPLEHQSPNKDAQKTPFAFFDARIKTDPIGKVPHLKIDVSDQVITIGERNYLEEVDPLVDVPDDPPPIPHVFTDTFIQQSIDINPAAPNWFVEKMTALLIMYHEVISWHDYDLGEVKDHPHKIELLPGAVGVRQPSRRHLYNPNNAAIIERRCRPFINMGVFRPCHFSDWCAQLVIAAKQRVCHDFTDLNKVTVPDAYPIKPMSSIFAKLAGLGIFSIWDADRGFMQIINEKEAMLRAAFELFGRHYMSGRMLFGNCTAPSTFLRNMDPVVEETQEEIPPDDVVENYYDDCLAGSPPGAWDSHLATTEAFLRVAQRHGWKFKFSKIRIGYFKIKILGVILSAAGKEADPDKVDALLAMKRPTNTTEVRSFAGLAQWFSEHIRGLSWKMKTLSKLAGNTKFEWSTAAENEFLMIKAEARLLLQSKLALWNPIKTTVVYTDASLGGLGCFITQLQDDGAECVIAFGSHALTTTQSKYHITRLEALAFIWTLGHFHVYLSARPFLWKTDHRALKFIFTASKTSVPVLQRYKLVADEYKFSPVWIEGSKMVADAFSRLCVVPADKHCAMSNREMVMADFNFFQPDDWKTRSRLRILSHDFLFLHADAAEEVPEQEPDIPEQGPGNQLIGPDQASQRDIPSLSASELMSIRAVGKVKQFLVDGTPSDEPKLQTIVKKLAKSCFVENRKLYKHTKGTIREIPDSLELRQEAFRKTHDGWGHKGLEGTLAHFCAQYWLPVVAKVAARYIARCEVCQRHSPPTSYVNPNHALQVHDIFTHWSVDFAGPFPPDYDGNKYVCIGICHLTRWAEIRLTKTNNASDAANFLYYEVVCRFGLPKSIQTDNGPHYANEVVERLCDVLKIRHHFSTPYYPQSNGRAERLIGTLKSIMIKAVQETDRSDYQEHGVVNWTPAIYSALYIYRASTHHATGVSPSYLVYGENAPLPFQCQFTPQPPTNQVTHKDMIADRLSTLYEVIPGLRASHNQFATTREGRKVLVRPAKYTIGEKVLLRNSKIDKAKSSPFEPKWLGPYIIHSFGDKAPYADRGAYRLRTIPELGKRYGILKNPVNWSRLRRWLDADDDEYKRDNGDEIVREE